MINRVALLASKAFNPVTVVTGLKYSSSLVKVFNNMTFLYDPNWEYQQGNPSYPIAFFFVKSMTEQMSSDVSQKPMLFYNTASDTNDSTAGGIMNIVADNLIVKPKTYKLDILVPANGSTLNNTLFDFENIANVNNFIFSGGSTGTNGFNALALAGNISLNFFKVLFTSLYGGEMNMSAVCNALLQQQDYNKASIEYMWSNRRILKLKLWNGWKFKYLIIKDFDVTKIGENGDFYEATLTCQETPILTFREQKQTSVSSLSKFSSSMGKIQKTVVDTFINAMSATLGEEK